MEFKSEGPLTTFANDAWIEQIIPADFNADGKTDFLVTRGFDNGRVLVSFVILLNQGNDTWQDKTASFFSGAVPQIYWAPRVAVADFNRDGRADVYIPDFGPDNTSGDASGVNPGGHDQIWLSGPDGKYTVSTNPVAGLSHGITIGDINRDGAPDLVVNGATFGVRLPSYDRILINDGAGHFTDTQSLLPDAMRSGNPSRTTHFWSQLVDANGDGWQDLVLGATAGGDPMAPSSAPSSVVLLNDGRGSYAQSTPIPLPHSPIKKESIVYMATTDINEDGRQDLLLSVTDSGTTADSFYTTGYLQILIGQGNGQFVDETAQRFPQQVAGQVSAWIKFIHPVDLNKDGATDLVLTGAGPNSFSGGGTIQILMNDGAGRFSRTQSMSASQAGAEAAAELDLGGTGYPDIIGSLSMAMGQVSLLAFGNPYEPDGQDNAIVGGKKDDSYKGLGGNDSIDGKEGTDTVVYVGNASQYRITREGGSLKVVDKVAGRDGSDTLANIEKLAFADMTLNLSASQVIGTVPTASLDRIAELYVAFFSRIPDADGLTYWVNAFRGGTPLNAIADIFYDAGVAFGSLTGYSKTMTNEQFVIKVYNNVLARKVDASDEGVKFWTSALADGSQRRGDLVSSILDAAHGPVFKDPTHPYHFVQTLLDNKLSVAKQVALSWGVTYNTATDSISKGMAIAAAVTPSDTSAAIQLVGLAQETIGFLG